MDSLLTRGWRRVGRVLGSILPGDASQGFAERIADRQPSALVEALGPLLNREPDLDGAPLDLNASSCFEDLAPLFASTVLDHAVICMSVREAAYTFRLLRTISARKVIEIGRYKGGSTLLLALAMSGEGTLWSVDLGTKETRLSGEADQQPFDDQLTSRLEDAGLTNVEMVVGDSRTVEIETGAVDVALLDGDHSYSGVKSDFNRFGRRVRPGGAVLLHDAFATQFSDHHADTVGRLVEQVVSGQAFEMVERIDSLAHLRRTAD